MTPSHLWTEGGAVKLANVVSLARLALVGPIAVLLLQGHRTAALVLYLLAVATDGIDGWLARSEGRASDFGATLDAVVDNLFALAIALFLWLAFPELPHAHPMALLALFGLPVLYLGLSWAMTGRVLMFHFHSARLGALLLFAVWPVMALTGWDGIVVLAALVVGASRVEQVLFILRGGRDQDARHAGAPVAAVRALLTERSGP